jgi:putative glutamine amidotransferase
VLAECDGLLLTGGADVDPQEYGDVERHPTLCVDPARDAYELVLVRAALVRGRPLLAICRGIQILNVATGGTLFQDLPSQRPSTVNHRVKEPPDQLAHMVTVTPGSRLAALLGTAATAEIQVNSRHHQAVNVVAPGFAAVATAPDGLVEGIEHVGSAFCVGVQWHPENFWEAGTFAWLFEGFVDAARASR